MSFHLFSKVYGIQYGMVDLSQHRGTGVWKAWMTSNNLFHARNTSDQSLNENLTLQLDPSKPSNGAVRQGR